LGTGLGDGSSAQSDEFCYLTTSGRHTGRPHRIEIWFALHEGVVHLLSGGGDRSDWVRNLLISPVVTLEIGDRKRTTKACVVTDPEEDALARRSLVDKYEGRGEGDLSDWGRTALPIAIAWPEP
jgi:deazaflavin-dependent oxidoreductase (nitroreductase family)